MFTGIIIEKGEVIEIQENDKGKLFEISCKKTVDSKKTGESIAVNGVCVTILDINDTSFKFLAMPETLNLTNLGTLNKGEKVNLEPALRLHQSLDGHFVQGHVDICAKVIKLKTNDKKTKLSISTPPHIEKKLAYKGSITINGVSLTISNLEKDKFSVDLIPHTLKNTNLNELKKGDKVNIEIDILSKYIENMLNKKKKPNKNI
ncbi:riboflavin synthase [Candidatus Peregrinibacteria bacterium]|nr:riboflavin synthase [Candidatus Peregrinibacteria bacterium]